MTQILIAVPVLNRPARAQVLADSVSAATESAHRVLFICSPGDDLEIEACRATGCDTLVAPWPAGPGDYARKINLAATLAKPDEDWLFQAADDLRFEPGWDRHALDCARRLQASVVGTNDLGNERVVVGEHSTHNLIRLDYVREFGTCDEPGKVMHEGYDHVYCDDELVRTAKARGVWAPCLDSVVEHLHPDWGKAERDATYELGIAHFHDDRVIFERRLPLMTGRTRRWRLWGAKRR